MYFGNAGMQKCENVGQYSRVIRRKQYGFFEKFKSAF